MQNMATSLCERRGHVPHAFACLALRRARHGTFVLWSPRVPPHQGCCNSYSGIYSTYCFSVVVCLRCCQRMRKSGGARVRARPQGIPAPGPPLLRRTRGRAAFPGPHPHGPVLRPVPSQLPRTVSRAACGFVRRIFQKRFRPDFKTVLSFVMVFRFSDTMLSVFFQIF